MHGSTSLVPAGDAFASQVEAFQISSPRRPSRESMAFRMHPQNAAETGKKLKISPDANQVARKSSIHTGSGPGHLPPVHGLPLPN